MVNTTYSCEMERRLLLLDVIRGLAIFFVLVSHVLQYYDSKLISQHGLPGVYYVTLGGFGVTLFIILSGMVTEYNYRGEKSLIFFIKRVKRIYSNYWVSLLLAIPLIGGYKVPADKLDSLLNVTGLMVFTGREWGESYILPTGWFIGVILSLYLLFPLLSKLMDKKKNTTLFALFLLSLCFRYYSERYWLSYRPSDWFPLCRLFEFGLGIYLIKNNNILNFLSRFNTKSSMLIYLSAMSFPAYLIHWPLLTVISLYPGSISIVFFFASTFILSYLIFYIDKYVQGKIFRF